MFLYVSHINDWEESGLTLLTLSYKSQVVLLCLFCCFISQHDLLYMKQLIIPVISDAGFKCFHYFWNGKKWLSVWHIHLKPGADIPKLLYCLLLYDLKLINCANISDVICIHCPHCCLFVCFFAWQVASHFTMKDMQHPTFLVLKK